MKHHRIRSDPNQYQDTRSAKHNKNIILTQTQNLLSGNQSKNTVTSEMESNETENGSMSDVYD